MGLVIRGHPLVPGEAEAEILGSSEPLSFWGGYDAVTGKIIDPGLLKTTASRIPVCRGTRVNIFTFDTSGGPTNTALSNGISCDSSRCSVLNIQGTEKYISTSADGKDTDRMTLVPK